MVGWILGSSSQPRGAVPGGVIGSRAANERRPLFRLHVGSGERKMEALILVRGGGAGAGRGRRGATGSRRGVAEAGRWGAAGALRGAAGGDGGRWGQRGVMGVRGDTGVRRRELG